MENEASCTSLSLFRSVFLHTRCRKTKVRTTRLAVGGGGEAGERIQLACRHLRIRQFFFVVRRQSSIVTNCFLSRTTRFHRQQEVVVRDGRLEKTMSTPSILSLMRLPPSFSLTILISKPHTTVRPLLFSTFDSFLDATQRHTRLVVPTFKSSRSGSIIGQ